MAKAALHNDQVLLVLDREEAEVLYALFGQKIVGEGPRQNVSNVWRELDKLNGLQKRKLEAKSTRLPGTNGEDGLFLVRIE